MKKAIKELRAKGFIVNDDGSMHKGMQEERAAFNYYDGLWISDDITDAAAKYDLRVEWINECEIQLTEK